MSSIDMFTSLRCAALICAVLFSPFGIAQAAAPKNCAQAAASLRPDESLPAAQQESILLEAAKVCPQLAEVHANLGILALRKKSYADARSRFTKANDIREDASFLAGLGAVAAAEGDLNEAEEYFDRSIALDRNSSQAIQGLAVIRIQQNELAEAEQLLRRAAQLTPEDPALFYNFGIVLARQGKLTEAIPSFRAALERKPDYFEAREQLTQSLLKENRFDEAEQILRSAVEQDSKDLLAAVMLAAVLEARGQLKPAEKTLLAAEAAAPAGSANSPALRLGKAVLRIKRGKVEEGIAELEAIRSQSAAEAGVPQSRLFSALGWAYLQKGETLKATEFLRQALAMDPKDQIAKINLEVATDLAGY